MVDLTGSATAERPDVRVIKDYVVRADGDRLASIARMIDGGHLKVEVQQVFPFERAPAALELVRPSTCAARSCSRSRDAARHETPQEASITEGGRVMAAKLGVHEGVIRPSLVQELEQYRRPDGRVSSYYLNLDHAARSERRGQEQGRRR